MVRRGNAGPPGGSRLIAVRQFDGPLGADPFLRGKQRHRARVGYFSTLGGRQQLLPDLFAQRLRHTSGRAVPAR